MTAVPAAFLPIRPRLRILAGCSRLDLAPRVPAMTASM